MSHSTILMIIPVLFLVQKHVSGFIMGVDMFLTLSTLAWSYLSSQRVSNFLGSGTGSFLTTALPCWPDSL